VGGDAVLDTDGPHLVDQGGTAGDQRVKYAMPCLKVDLLDRSRMSEAHRWARYGFSNDLSVDVLFF
jgi:hypothetical protein